MASSDRLHELSELFRLVSRRISVEWSRRVEQPLSGSQSYILEILEAEGPQNVSALAERLGITAGAVTGLSDKLISAGFARRFRAEDDRRVVYLDITPRGAERLKTVREKRHQLIGLLFGGLPDEDVNHLIRIYKQVLRNIETPEEE